MMLVLVAMGYLIGSYFVGYAIRRGNDADPGTLDPHRSSTVAEAHILRDLYEQMLAADSRMKAVRLYYDVDPV